ncbi:MAG: hypothetical protein OQL28_14300 [Sedimenticola sp.]|nr:hypothetical protein [Sedimenticola sp.]
MFARLLHKLRQLFARSISDIPPDYQRCAMICKSDYCSPAEYERCEKRKAYLQFERED